MATPGIKRKYKGIIIEESLGSRAVLKKLEIISTKIEKVTEKHQSPWLDQWTLHTFEVVPEKTAKIARLLSQSLETKHAWYTDFNNGEIFYVIFRGKIFRYRKKDKEGRQKAVDYGLSLGIPVYQLDFPG